MSRVDYDSVLQVKAGLRINRLIEDYAYETVEKVSLAKRFFLILCL